ncbi:FtsX-like permease family protein [Cryptosporangium sp. NPDC051539]|uniref:FtsX-like permease family protein n=1 Tax=Cryptosporangium sp. NPDC051539 TaxID=3363962 RepID=UPI00379CD204
MIRRPDIRIHWPSVRGRARADVGPLGLVAAVVLVVTLLGAAVPQLIRATADDATRDAVRRAGLDSDVRVDSRWPDDYGLVGGRFRFERLAADVDDFRAQAVDTLDPRLRAALRRPVTTASSLSLQITDASIPRRFQLNYVQNDHGGPDVTWVAGHAPRGTVDGDVVIDFPGPPWEVQVGLSETEAAVLKLRPGDHVPVEDAQRTPYNVLVSGIFRPVDPNDPAWQVVPWLLRGVPGLDSPYSSRFGGMLSAESLPDGRLAVPPDQFRRTVWFTTDPGKLGWDSAQRLARTVVALKARSGTSTQYDTTPKWDTRLDDVLRGVRDQVAAARAQASLLLIAVLTGAVLVLLLTADLIARRRSTALAAARERGASLPSIAAELLVEAGAVALPAAALGLVLSLVLVGGAAIGGAATVLTAALLAGPALGTLVAARATRDRRTPANRTARRRHERTTQLRSAAVDVAVVAAAAAAVGALRQRGIQTGGDGALPASAPTLVAVAGSLLLRRLMPVGIGLTLRQLQRSRRLLAVLGAARASATAARTLPLLVLVTTTTLATFALTLGTTSSRGSEDGAWRVVGADARLDVSANSPRPRLAIAAEIAAAPGVDQVVTAQIDEGVRVLADGNRLTPGLVVADSAELAALLRHYRLPDTADLERLKGSRPGPIPVLVRSSDDSLRPGMHLQLSRAHGPPVDLVAVGTAPAVNGAEDLIVADAKAGLGFEPDTVWANGPGAARAMHRADGQVVVRSDILRARTGAPLNAGLMALDRAAAGTLLVLGSLGFALGAAASAPERWSTLARLRTLGLRPRDTHRVAAIELLPPVLVAIVSGPLLGLLLVRLTFSALALRTLTGQTENPSVVAPWWLLGVTVTLLLGVLIAVVAAEAAVRRSRRLGDVLRVGG